MSRRTPSGISHSDNVREAAAVVAARPLRTLLTAAGVVLGVSAFVATTGLTQTASTQISSQFDALRATEVRVQPAAQTTINPFDLTPDHRLEVLNGVRSAGLLYTAARPGHADINITPTRNDLGDGIPTFGASPGALAASHITLSHGRTYGDFQQDNAANVALLGTNAAARLGIATSDNAPAIFIHDQAFVVVGIIESTDRNTELLSAVVLPSTTAYNTYTDTGPTDAQVIIDVAPGAAQTIGRQAPVALRPDNPDQLRSLVPPDPAALRESIESDVSSLLYGLSVLALLIGTVSITNAQLLAVTERRGEIGLRRALGASRQQIMMQITLESAASGALAGVAGTIIGIAVTLAIAVAQGWTPTIDPVLVLAAPPIGIASAIAAGLVPARRAASLPPATTLRAQ